MCLLYLVKKQLPLDSEVRQLLCSLVSFPSRMYSFFCLVFFFCLFFFFTEHVLKIKFKVSLLFEILREGEREKKES